MLISILGGLGDGKTLIETFFALLDSRPIYSNYWINSPRYHDLKPEMLNRLSNCLVLLDEAWAYIDSRVSGSDHNRYFSYILTQSRKMGIDIVMTDQLEGMIDTRFRQLTDWEIHCSAENYGYDYWFIRRKKNRLFMPVHRILPLEIAEKIYPYYDTGQRINPIDDELILRVTQDKTEIMAKVDAVVLELLSKAPAKAYTKGVVSDICIRRGLTRSYVNLIHNAIRASVIPA